MHEYMTVSGVSKASFNSIWLAPVTVPRFGDTIVTAQDHSAGYKYIRIWSWVLY